jgi:hypothetical protein
MTQNDTPAGKAELVRAGGTRLIWIPLAGGPGLSAFVVIKGTLINETLIKER